MEPVADHAGAGWKLRRFPHAEQQPGAEELAEALHKSGDELASDQRLSPQVNRKRGPNLSTIAPVGNCENA